jgi:hypothetical protein
VRKKGKQFRQQGIEVATTSDAEIFANTDAKYRHACKTRRHLKACVRTHRALASRGASCLSFKRRIVPELQEAHRALASRGASCLSFKRRIVPELQEAHRACASRDTSKHVCTRAE